MKTITQCPTCKQYCLPTNQHSVCIICDTHFYPNDTFLCGECKQYYVKILDSFCAICNKTVNIKK